MVVGLQRFRDHFRAHTVAFVLIGGAACDAWMTANALTFRRTKDLDIVLVADAVDAAFAERFRAFVDEGGYEVRQRQESGKREFFRFYKPKGDDYPFMLEPQGESLDRLAGAQGCRSAHRRRRHQEAPERCVPTGADAHGGAGRDRRRDSRRRCGVLGGVPGRHCRLAIHSERSPGHHGSEDQAVAG